MTHAGKLPLPENYEQLGVNLANDALGRALESADVVAAAQAWNTCMQPAGIPAFRRRRRACRAIRWRRPSGSMTRTAPHLRQKSKSRQKTPRVERRAATTWRLYNAEWRFQSEALAENADALVAEQREAQAYLARIQETLASLGDLSDDGYETLPSRQSGTTQPFWLAAGFARRWLSARVCSSSAADGSRPRWYNRPRNVRPSSRRRSRAWSRRWFSAAISRKRQPRKFASNGRRPRTSCSSRQRARVAPWSRTCW